MMNNVIGKVLTLAHQRDRQRLKRKQQPEKVKREAAECYGRTKAVTKKRNKRWKQDNKPKLNATRNKYAKKQRETNPSFVLAQRCRDRLRHALDAAGTSKALSTYALLGTTPDALVQYLGWKKVGETRHIDHIFAITQYNLSLPGAQESACHYSNLQLLSKEENVDKFNKLPTKAMAAKVDRANWPPGITEDMLPDIYPGWATPLRM
jgi:5-methylcytosine-specific restriction endonuclease McrA